MAKQNKKSKNNELDAILDRLKKYYGASSPDGIDDPLASDESEEDAELNAILGKIFSDDAEKQTSDGSFDGNDVESDSSEALKVTLAENKEDLTSHNDEVISNKADKEPPEEQDSSEETEEGCEKSDSDSENLRESVENEDLSDDGIFDEFDENPENDDMEDDDIEFENLTEEDSSEDETLSVQEDFVVEDEEFDVSTESELLEDNIDYDVSYERDNEESFKELNDVSPTLGKLILEPEDYTYDDLQNNLPGFRALTTVAEAEKSPAEIEASAGDSENRLDNNDISLLLKFGYEEEVKTQIGEKNTQKAVFEIKNQFSPEPHKKLFGFCGKEFSEREQIPEIKAKYKSDKKSMIVKLSVISFISLTLLLSTVFFDFFSDRASFPIVLAMESFLVILIGAVLYREMFSGFMGIIRLEADLYSLLAFLLSEYILYSISAFILYVTDYKSIYSSDLMLFGFTFSLYAIITVIADYVNCVKEYNTFILMTTSKSIYTAEKQRNRDWGYIPDEKREKNSHRHAEVSNNAYKICEASIISGYFRKTYQQNNGMVNLMYILGVSPVIALITGCICALISGNVMRGASSVMITSILCLPLSIVFLPALSEYIISIKLRKHKAAFLGAEAAVEYSKTDTVIFKDTDAVEIVSVTNILPGDSSDEQTSAVEIAKTIFNKLGGPLDIALNNAESEYPKHDIAINKISDNGIEILYDSSVTVLIGNKHYMNTHGIKVKTDSNLSTAIKGSDRSVVFMAFDGVPKLGFIINSNVKSEFWKTAAALESEGIKTYVETYEPQINDLYFEQNKKQNNATVGVYKPDEYEQDFGNQMRDGSVFSAKNSLSVADVLPLSKETVSRRKANKRLNMVMVIAGIIMSCVFAFFVNAPGSIPFLQVIKDHIVTVFNTVIIIGFIPTIVSLIRQRKSK